MTTTATAIEATVTVGETQLQLLKGGDGPPAVVLHGIEGPEGWLAFHEALSRRATVYAPSQPGYTGTSRPEWMETNGHVAAFYEWFLQNEGLGQVDLIGIGVGGWIAAEMAVMNPHNLRHLVLVDAAGIKPAESEALDVFIHSWREVIERCFSDPERCAEYDRIYSARPVADFGGHRESGRAMALRTCYRPYMYNPALPALLGRVDAPTLVVWGEDDQVIPVECGRLYQQAIPGAELRTIAGAGHWPHYEKPDELASLVLDFISR
jgi:pimeloyl-ACP methyl ester carboxylesterase